MADITESAVWEDSIYELATTDPVKGGTPVIGVDGSVVSGHANVQAQKLANRTKWLKQRVDGWPEVVDAAGTANGLVVAHNSNPNAHPELIDELATKATPDFVTTSIDTHNHSASAHAEVSAAIKEDFANTTDPAKGAGMVGFGGESLGAYLEKFPKFASTMGEAVYQTNEAIGGALTIACYGDSLTYGYDVVTGTEPPINGSTDARALYQYPEAIGAALTSAGYTVTVENRGFPGDTTVEGLSRWSSASATNIAIIMYGTNDALPVSGQPKVSPANFKSNLVEIVEREITKGAFVVLLTPPRLRQANLSGTVEQRQQWMMAYSSIIKQIGDLYCIPTYSVDELVSHRGPEIYSDDTHFNKWGYNEWGWNLAAAFVRRDFNVTSIAPGTKIEAAGGILQGNQTLLSGNTVMALNTSTPAIIAANFEQDVVAVVDVGYSPGVGGTQRVAIEVSGGSRSSDNPQTRVVAATTTSGAKLHSQVIPRGLRFVVLKVSSTTTNAYVRSVRFYGLGQKVLTDTTRDSRIDFNLTSMSYPVTTETNRWLIDDCSKISGDFDVTLDIDVNPGVGESCGASLVFTYSTNDGSPSKYVNIIRTNAAQALVRIADPAITDYVTPGVVFSGGSSKIRITRVGTSYEVFADGVSVHAFTFLASNCNPAIFVNRAAFLVRDYYNK